MSATSPRQLWPLKPNVLSAVGIKPSSAYEQIRAGTLPRPVACGPRSKRFLSDEIQAVVEARAAGANDAQIKALVQQLHAARVTFGAPAA